jgi:hypothetical protein
MWDTLFCVFNDFDVPRCLLRSVSFPLLQIGILRESSRMWGSSSLWEAELIILRVSEQVIRISIIFALD